MEEPFGSAVFNKKLFFLVLLFLVFLLFLSSCEKGSDSGVPPSSEKGLHSSKEEISSGDGEEQLVIPLKPEKGSFYSAYGWLDNFTIVYITEFDNKSGVYAYNLRDGNNEFLYESEDPIVSLEISPSRKHILIHSSPSSYEGRVVIIDTKGEVVLSENIPSAELTFEWNPFDENTILISAFDENWDHTSYELNILEQSISDIFIPQPFAYWIERNSLLYLDWNENSLQLNAPLKKYDLNEDASIEIVSDIFHVQSFGDTFLALSVNQENEDSGDYTFYSESFKKIDSYQIPLLSRFSDWLVPYYDFISHKDLFFTLQPLYPSTADTYGEKFQLVSYDLTNGEQTVLLENLNNEPLSCSPDGSLCLFGYYLEKIINLESKEIISLME